MWPLDGCSSRDLSAQLWAAAPTRSCFGGLIRSLPDSLPRVVARYKPASRCFLPGRRRYDVAYRKEPNVAMPIVAEQYTFVIGVDTHAATHSLALVIAATGAVVDEAVFPNTPPGLDRALGWITRRIAEQSALVVIEGVGSYGAGLAQRVTDAGRAGRRTVRDAGLRASRGRQD